MATLAKAPRTSITTLATETVGPFDLGFRLFDSDAVSVYVDGVARSDWALSAVFEDGFTDAALITFASPLPVDTEIRFDADLEPGRAQDYLNGPGLVSSLNIELGRLWSIVADLKRDARRSVRMFSEIAPFEVGEGKTIIRTADGYGEGPSTDAILAVQSNADAAAISAQEAADSAAQALAAENSLLFNRGEWATATAYTPSNIVQGVGATYTGSSYICLLPHTSGDFGTDLAAGRWAVFAGRGATGPGSGDLLSTNDLSDLANAVNAQVNLGVDASANTDFTIDPAKRATRETIAAYVQAALSALVAPAPGELYSYVWARRIINGDVAFGDLVAGSELRATASPYALYANAESLVSFGSDPTVLEGQWACAGRFDFIQTSWRMDLRGATLWQRRVL